jgi:ascorbate-specific PTS system EIIC-type component UlaA
LGSIFWLLNILLTQESQSGLITGLGDFILSHFPQASSMPSATYGELFGGPWAKDKEHEAKHKKLSKSIGESLRGEILF